MQVLRGGGGLAAANHLLSRANDALQSDPIRTIHFDINNLRGFKVYHQVTSYCTILFVHFNIFFSTISTL